LSRDADEVDELFFREHRRREVAEKVYGTFLTAANGVPEEEWRLLAIECVLRLSGGLGASIRGDASAREFGLARCGHCEALLSGRELNGHVCKPEDLERVKRMMTSAFRIALNEQNFRDLVAGKSIAIGAPPVALLILSDIGFSVMLDAIDCAQHEKKG
jgi:hypothetical protein